MVIIIIIITLDTIYLFASFILVFRCCIFSFVSLHFVRFVGSIVLCHMDVCVGCREMARCNPSIVNRID